MADYKTFLLLSDIHFAGASEKERTDFELKGIANPALRLLVRFYRRYFWLRDPFAQNHLLDAVLETPGAPDYVIANGDYSCDSAFIGVSDPAAFASAQECLAKLRARFGTRFHPVMGDHELGKISLFGGNGGMRLASWQSARAQLNINPFWKIEVGSYVWIGIASSLVALPVFEPETLESEREDWRALRREHLHQIRTAFQSLHTSQRLLLFCHDPSALPFLWQEEIVREKSVRIECTFIGHLHSNLIFWKSQILAGMPPIRFCGNSIRRMSSALHQAKYWRPFNVFCCPSLAGIELLKDGGYVSGSFDPQGQAPLRLRIDPITR